MSNKLPTSPPGSVIVVTDRDDGAELSWIPEPSRPWALIAFTALWLGVWSYGEWFVVGQFFRGGFAEGASTIFMACWLGGWTVAGVLVITMFVRTLHRPLPEWLQIGDKWFTHNEGRRPMTLARLQSLRTWWPASARRSRTIKRDANLRFGLDNSGSRQRLTYDHEGEQYEVGETLRAPEREWLSQVLGDWTGQDSQKTAQSKQG